MFPLFVTLWIMAASFHYLDSHPLTAVSGSLLLLAIPSVLRPRSTLAFGVFVASSSVAIGLDLPAASNHSILALLIQLIFIGAAVDLRLRSEPGPGSRDGFNARWLESVRSAAVVTLVVVYALAAFHKLNSSFFDPGVSCAGVLLAQVVRLQGWPPALLSELVIVISAYAVVVVETVIVLFLANPRLRLWGIIAGILFHACLAPAQFYDFATYVFAIYLLLVPQGVIQRLGHWERSRHVVLGAWFVYALAAVLFRVGSDWGVSLLRLQFIVWCFAVAVVWGPIVMAWFNEAPGDTGARWLRVLSVRPPSLAIVPVIALLNGLTPYLGLKTAAAFSMFSNLRTEQGSTNHFVPGVQRIEIANYLRDIVDVRIDSFPASGTLGFGALDHARGGMFWLRRQTRWLRTGHVVRLPWLEFRRAALLWKDAGLSDVQVSYRRHGIQYENVDATKDPILTAPMPWWERRLLAFREIERGTGAVACRW